MVHVQDTSSTSHKMPYRRYITAGAGCLLAVTTGTGYMFSAYAPELKSTMGYSQTQINLVSSISSVTGYAASFLVGMMYDRFGPRATAIFGSVLLFSGYFGMYNAARFRFYSNDIMMGAFLALTSIGSGAAYTSALATNIKNFPAQYRGRVVGIIAGLYGLSAFVFTNVYQHTFSPDEIKLFLFLSIALPSIILFGGMFLSLSPPQAKEEEGKEEEEKKSLIADQRTTINSVVVSYGASDSIATEGEGTVACEEGGLDQMRRAQAPRKGQALEIGPVALAQTAEFWLLAYTIMCITGPGLTVIGNLGSLAVALGSTPAFQNDLVMILSLANFSGRLLFGTLSDAFAPRVSRGFWLCVIQMMMGVALVLLAFSPLYVLPVGVALVGVAYGGSWAIQPALVSELWGPRSYGANAGLIGLGCAAGAIGFGTFLASSLYNHAIPPDQRSRGDTMCVGVECYQTTLLILSVVAVSGLLTSILFVRRTRSYFFGATDWLAAKYFLHGTPQTRAL